MSVTAPDIPRSRLVKNAPYWGYIDPRINPSDWFQETFAFTATNAEIYDVLSLLNPPDAFALLSKGVRTEAGVKQALATVDALDVITPRRDLMDVLIGRGIDPLVAADALMWTSYDVRGRANLSSCVYAPTCHADAIELCMLLSQSHGRSETLEAPVIAIRNSMLEGRITLEIVKALLPEVKLISQIGTIYAGASDLTAVPRQYDFTLEDLKVFTKRAAADFYEISLAHLISTFAIHGLEAMDKVQSLAELTNYVSLVEMGGASNRTQEEVAGKYRLAMRSAMLQQAVTEHRPLTGSEWLTIVDDAQALHDSGVDLTDATPYLVKGVPARKIKGILDGVSQGVAEGWL